MHHKKPKNKNYTDQKNQYTGSCTTTMGKRSEGMPPGGNESSLLRELYDLSGHPPFARYGLGLSELLELATLQFPTAFEESKFMSDIFLIFFSWTCNSKEIHSFHMKPSMIKEREKLIKNGNHYICFVTF